MMRDSNMQYRNARRRFPRLPCQGETCRFKILFIGDRPVDLPEGEAKLVNVSRGGLSFITNLRLPLQLPTLCRIRFTVQHVGFDLCAKLIWMRAEAGGDQYRYGFRYWGASPAALAATYERLDQLQVDMLA